MSRATLLLVLLIACCFGCAPPSSQGDGSASPASDNIPELSDDVIRDRINYTWIREVPSENANSEPINWGFGRDKPTEIVVVDKKVDGTRATVILDIKTGSSDRTRRKLYVAGQLRTEWELRTGWVMRRWAIVDTENISMKYRDIPKPSEQNSKAIDPANPQ